MGTKRWNHASSEIDEILLGRRQWTKMEEHGNFLKQQQL
jgi:hypothetical protein